MAHFVFLFPVDAQNGIYVLTVDEGESISSTEVDRGAFYPFRMSHPPQSAPQAVFILPRGQTTGINTLLLGVLPFLECMTLSRTENHSYNVQAARPQSPIPTVLWVHSFWNDKPPLGRISLVDGEALAFKSLKNPGNRLVLLPASAELKTLSFFKLDHFLSSWEIYLSL